MWPSEAETLGVGFQKTIPSVNGLILFAPDFQQHGHHVYLLIIIVELFDCTINLHVPVLSELWAHMQNLVTIAFLTHTFIEMTLCTWYQGAHAELPCN